ncbi:uncharacterized protein LOC129693462 [Leucoraja erinacea]|uniref:uncharacterized protein LOC129693462 n=1 Tax=Leucoraja erinaceus TaxID=7782 RepID=UPI00245403F7|nr:uncharacterized protein LOC129693462 [Leucoraja erinacea]
MNRPSSEAQQESREIILEIKTIPRWNTESLLNQSIEQKEIMSKQQRDTQMDPPLHISLTNPRGQETNLSQLEGLHYYVKEENEKNAATVSESPNNEREDLEVKHTMFASTENTIKQEESECLGIPSASNRSTPNLKIQSHERDIDAKEITDSGNVAPSNNKIITQSSELFAINGSHLQHVDSVPFALNIDEAVTSHATDTSTNSTLEINRPLGNNLHKIPANDMQNNLVIIPDVMGVCGKLTSNKSHPTKLVKDFANSEDKSVEDVNLIGDASSIGESESFHDSAICTDTDNVFEPGRISSLFHDSVSSEDMQIFSARISDVQMSSQYSTEADNLEAKKLEDLFTKPHSLKKGTESAHVQNPTNRTDKVIPSLTQVPETNVADEQKKDKVGAPQIAERCISNPPCMLADAMVKDATEAALLAITGDEGMTEAAASPSAKALTNDEQHLNQEVTTVLNLPSLHGEPSNIHVANEGNTKSVPEFSEHATETSTRHVQVEKITSQAAQKNTKEKNNSRVSLHTMASLLPLEDALHNGKQSLQLIQNLTAAFQMIEEDSRGGTTATNIGKGAANYVQMAPDLQEDAQKRFSHEITETTENIYEFQNCDVKKKQMIVGATEPTGAEGHDKEKGNENGKYVKVKQNCSVSESDYSHHYSVSDVNESLEGGRVNLEEEGRSNVEHALYAKADESMKYTQMYGVSQVATEIVLSCELTAGEVDHHTSAECDNVKKYRSGVDNETGMQSEGATNTFSESPDDNYSFKKGEMFHNTQHIPTNRSTSQEAPQPKVNISLDSTMCTVNYTKGETNIVFSSQQNSELNNHHKCLDPIMLINTPVKKDDGKETDTDVTGDIHPNSEQLKSRECNEGTQKEEQVGEAFGSNVDSIDSELDSELFTNEDTLKSTLWKVCYSVLFVVFLVTIYHYDFIGCFILYLFSLYWLYCEGEESSDSVRKD